MKNSKLQLKIQKFKNLNWKFSEAFGFTLIELLIVMSIIGILAAISIFGLQGARESARDGRRKADLEEIRSGLELYKADCNRYPALPWAGNSLVGSGATCQPSGNVYIGEIPGDPLGGNYYYRTTGITYILCATLEDPPASPDSCSGCASCNYRTTNP